MTPRVLFTTVYRNSSEPYDYIGANTRSWFRFYRPRIQSFGLRFLKQNIPELEILEFPTWEVPEEARGGMGCGGALFLSQRDP